MNIIVKGIRYIANIGDKSGSLMLNSLHLKRSEDCNLNLITVGKLNTEVNSYVPFWLYQNKDKKKQKTKKKTNNYFK
jgi:hypothetical protein